MLIYGTTADITWKDIDYIKKHAPGIPVIVKGVLSVDDMELAYKHGASAVVLSNHGVSLCSKGTLRILVLKLSNFTRVANWIML